MLALNPLHTVLKQVTETLTLHKGMTPKQARDRTLELLQLVRMQEPEQKLLAYPHQLSGGQRQRVMIAMALANEPDLLIADEPTTAVDVTIQAQILSLLTELQQQLSMSILLITHDLDVVRKTSNRLYVMHSGTIIEHGQTEQLFRAPAEPYTRQLIEAALDAGARSLVLTLGGSATNDAGAGMLAALGARLLDSEDRPLPPGGAALADLATLDLDGLDPRLASLEVRTAVDVDNPLLGPRGASAIFGPQKGATSADVERLDRALSHFADHAAHALGEDFRELPGAGAAGGMGFAARAFLGATLRPGIELVMEQVKFDALLANADWVITGEGQLDGQSLSGKTPIGIARRAERFGVPTVALVGRLGDQWQAAFDHGITAAFALADGPITLDEALSRCGELLSDRARTLARLWQVAPR